MKSTNEIVSVKRKHFNEANTGMDIEDAMYYVVEFTTEDLAEAYMDSEGGMMRESEKCEVIIGQWINIIR